MGFDERSRRRDALQALKRPGRLINATAMHALLERSVKFGHKRLALMRYTLLEQMRGQASAENLRYCERVAEDLPQQIVKKIMYSATCDLLARQESRMLVHSDHRRDETENIIVRIAKLL